MARSAVSRATQVASDGPPGSYVIDRDVYEVVAESWWPALVYVGDQGNGWCLQFLLAVTNHDDALALMHRLMNAEDPLDIADIAPVAQRLVEIATARDWWVAGRTAAIINASWEALDGRLLGKGVDLRRLLQASPSRAYSVVLEMINGALDENKRRQFEADLMRPPRGPVQRRSIEEDAAAFESAFSSPLLP